MRKHLIILCLVFGMLQPPAAQAQVVNWSAVISKLAPVALPIVLSTIPIVIQATAMGFQAIPIGVAWVRQSIPPVPRFGRKPRATDNTEIPTGDNAGVDGVASGSGVGQSPPVEPTRATASVAASILPSAAAVPETPAQQPSSPPREVAPPPPPKSADVSEWYIDSRGKQRAKEVVKGEGLESPGAVSDPSGTASGGAGSSGAVAERAAPLQRESEESQSQPVIMMNVAD